MNECNHTCDKCTEKEMPLSALIFCNTIYGLVTIALIVFWLGLCNMELGHGPFHIRCGDPTCEVTKERFFAE